MNKIKRLLNDAYWWLGHRIFPGHRYHIMKTGLKPGYYDPDTRILYAVMTEVSRFAEMTRDVIDWDTEEGHRHAGKTLIEVADWWKNRTDPDCVIDAKEEDRLRSKEDEMLCAIMKIRGYLWYP